MTRCVRSGLFASKIADSVVEGSQAVTDKQMADISAGVQYSEAAEAAAATPEGAEAEPAAVPSTDESEDVSMEEVLGKGGRRAAAEIPTRRSESRIDEWFCGPRVDRARAIFSAAVRLSPCALRQRAGARCAGS